jgi:hypothetical protein
MQNEFLQESSGLEIQKKDIIISRLNLEIKEIKESKEDLIISNNNLKNEILKISEINKDLINEINIFENNRTSRG